MQCKQKKLLHNQKNDIELRIVKRFSINKIQKIK